MLADFIIEEKDQYTKRLTYPLLGSFSLNPTIRFMWCLLGVICNTQSCHKLTVSRGRKVNWYHINISWRKQLILLEEVS